MFELQSPGCGRDEVSGVLRPQQGPRRGSESAPEGPTNMRHLLRSASPQAATRLSADPSPQLARTAWAAEMRLRSDGPGPHDLREVLEGRNGSQEGGTAQGNGITFQPERSCG
jgi:hypothetical protein